MKIIVIDGPDGVGKTTAAKLVEEKLNKLCIRAKYFHFPDYSYYTGDFINKCLHGELGDFTDVNYFAQHMMYALDRYCWFKRNGEEYENYVLIFDRYTTSSQVFQLATKYLDDLKNSFFAEDLSLKLWFTNYEKENLEFLNYIETREYYNLEIPAPDIVFWLDADEETLKNRLNDREEAKDNFEEDSFSNIVYKTGLYVSKKLNWRITKADGIPQVIAEDIVNSIITDIYAKNSINYLNTINPPLSLSSN